MKKLAYLLTCFLLVRCTVSITTMTHNFEHHGTDQLMTNSDFFYVKQNATGTSSTSYNFNKYGQYLGGGDVRKGLIADAKGTLATLYPLQPNQAYINMSIDITKATRAKHYRTGGTISEEGMLQKITYYTTVSADIIEYGESPLTKEFNKKNNDSGSMDELEAKKLGELQLQEGQEITYKHIDGINYPAIVIRYNPSDKSYQIRFTDDGQKKLKNILPGSYRRLTP